MQIVIDVALNDPKYFLWKLGLDLKFLGLYYNVN